NQIMAPAGQQRRGATNFMAKPVFFIGSVVMVHTTEEDARLTTSQVARRLSISSQRVRQLLDDGTLRCERTPLGALVSLADVDELAEQRQRQRAARIQAGGE